MSPKGKVVVSALLVLGLCHYAWPFPRHTSSAAFSEDLRREIRTAVSTRRAGPIMKGVAAQLDLAALMVGKQTWEAQSPKNLLFCSTCNLGVAEIISEVNGGVDPEALGDLIIALCVDLGISNYNFCEHIIHLATPELYWIITHRELTGKDVCGMIFMRYGCKTDNPERVWEVMLPDTPKPPVLPPSVPEPGSPVMKVLHLADTHFDPLYMPGSNAECGEKFFCCRESSGPLDRPEAAAGKWGDYRNCDAPKWLLQAMYDHIASTYTDLDFIIWTGDLVPHNVWNTSKQENLEVIRETVQMLRESFPGVPVFPALGNHESTPVNSFPQPYIENEFDISWLYDEMATLWETWLPQETATTVVYNACYSTLVKPGLRVISVNSNYGYGFNWWMVYDDKDPGSELQWMAEQLQLAEDNDEKVYLISHIAPGDVDCIRSWGHQYNKIVVRYESTIAGLFYAHTHYDHYMVFYDHEQPDRPVHVGYVAQSQTPYPELNPGYKVYTVDGAYEGSSYRVLDHENWIIDLDEANKNDFPNVTLLYSAKEAYGLSDLSPTSWSNLVFEMNQPNSTLFEDFYRHYTKAGRPYAERGCDDKCKSDTLCRLLVSDNSDISHCDLL
ncbi:sphingomyelin phosphodiesterase [Penaeus vannamei]|uniref:sphingomyelin phosphodiesterase n=1 Tax=Penaeus vannamei TaxID=6689 RepID=UPI00387F70D6